MAQFQSEVKRKRRESLCRHGSTTAITSLIKVSGFEIQFTDLSAPAVIRNCSLAHRVQGPTSVPISFIQTFDM